MPRRRNEPRFDPAKWLDEMFPRELLLQLSRETGMVQRQRLLDPVLFFWVLVLDFGANFMRTLRGLHRNYEAAAQAEMSISRFVKRFTPELEEFLHRCVLHAIEFQAREAGRELGEKLKHFSDVLILDSTIIRLSENLADIWPAALSRKKAAGVKLSCLMSVVADGPKRVRIVPERTAEAKTLKLGPWVEGKALLFDLGFFKLRSFRRIGEYKGYFVTRLKKKVNATIVGVNRTCPGNARELIGEDLWEISTSLKRGVIDVEVEFDVTSRRYRGKQTTTKWRCRAVGVYNADEKKYHLYLANVPLELMPPEDVARLYGARWEIELVFKELKTHYRMDKLSTEDPQTIKCLIWTAILVMICSRRILHMLRKINPENAHRFTLLRMATIFMEMAPDVLRGIADILGVPFGYMEKMNLYESLAMDPNKNRKRMMDDFVK